jgi:hypothetical protein
MAQNILPDSATEEFLRRILPESGVFQAFTIRQGGAKNHAFTSHSELAEFLRDKSERDDAVYHACAAYIDGSNRKAHNTKSMKALWLDLDCGEEKARDGKGYRTQEDALNALKAFCKKMDLPKPLIVDSGGGLHIYWPLTEMIEASHWKAIAAKLKRATEAHGLLADASRTADAASVLRPVGTLNRKYDPPCSVMLVCDAPDVDVAVIEAALELLPSSVAPHLNGLPKTIGGLANLTGYIEPDVVAAGSRNDKVLKYVGHLRGKGTPESVILSAALNFNKAKCQPPLDDDEVAKVVASYAAQGHPDAPEWQEPRPIVSSLHPAPVLDFDMLPRVFVDFVRDTSERMGVPPDNIAIPLMLSASAALGSGWVVCPKAVDKSWRETPVLWGGLVARPGSKKSECLKLAAAPLHRIEAAQKVAYKKAHAQWQVEKGKVKDDPIAKMTLVEPKLERAVVMDATYQALAEVSAASPRGLMAQWDEITGPVSAWRIKGQEPARAFFLTGWSGDQPYTIDRKEGGTTHIPRLSIVISGGAQPTVVGVMVRDARQNNDGLIQRFQLLICPDPSHAPKDVDRKADELAKNRAMGAIEALRSLTPVLAGVEPNGDTEGGVLNFAQGAQEGFTSLRQKIEAAASDERCAPLLASHYLKMPGAIAKIAMLIHLLDGGKGDITPEATERAVRWAKYMRAHARRLYSLSELADEGAANRILEGIKAGALPDGFTAYELARKGWTGLSRPEDVEAGLAALVKAGWLRVMPPAPAAGGRPTTRYAAHPQARK